MNKSIILFRFHQISTPMINAMSHIHQGRKDVRLTDLFFTTVTATLSWLCSFFTVACSFTCLLELSFFIIADDCSTFFWPFSFIVLFVSRWMTPESITSFISSSVTLSYALSVLEMIHSIESFTELVSIDDELVLSLKE